MLTPSPHRLLALSAYLPRQAVANQAVEQKALCAGKPLPPGTLQRMFGLRERRFAAADEQVSDLAAEAARPLLEAMGTGGIDLMIFAAASSDVIEPATANIVQEKLGLACPVFDVKNACNSFLTALQIAQAYVQAGMARQVLVCAGEKPSEVIRYATRSEDELALALAGYTLGDGGAAALVGRVDDEGDAERPQGHRLLFEAFHSEGNLWHLCTIKSGGSQAPRDVEQSYFVGYTRAMLQGLRERALPYLAAQLRQAGIGADNIDLLIVHQISAQTIQMVAAQLGVPAERCFSTFAHTGNTAATSLPLAMVAAQQAGRLLPGMRVALVGLASGISIGLQIWQWGHAPAFAQNLEPALPAAQGVAPLAV